MSRLADRLPLIAFAAMVLLGGTNFVAVRFSNRELPPFWGAGLRFAAAAALLVAFAAAQKVPWPKGRALWGTLIYGALGFGVTYALAYSALRHVPAGLAAVVLASTPLLTFLLALLHRQERFRWRPLAGGLIALVGIGVIFRGSVHAAVPLLSLLAMVGAALALAEAAVIIKGFPKTHPVSTNAVAMATGVVILLLLSLLLGESRHLPARTSTWMALGYLSVLGSSAAFVLFLYILKRWTASAVAYQFVLFPIVAIVVAALLEHAPVSSSLLVGGGFVLAGVYAGTVSQPQTSAEARPKLGPEPCLTCAE